MARDLDPACREMREQVRMLRGLDDAGVSRTSAACDLSEALGGSIEGWRTQLGRCCSGKARLSIGAYRVLLQRMEMSQRLAMARAAHVDLDLRIEPMEYPDVELTSDELAGRTMEVAGDAIAAARATWAGLGDPARHRSIADAHHAIAAGLEALAAATGEAA